MNQEQMKEKDLDYDEGSSFLHNAQSRFLLMQKLTRENPSMNLMNQNEESGSEQSMAMTVPKISNVSATAPSTTMIAGKKIIPEANIFVKNLDPTITVGQLESVFSIYGNILSAKIATDPLGNSLGYGYKYI